MAKKKTLARGASEHKEHQKLKALLLTCISEYEKRRNKTNY